MGSTGSGFHAPFLFSLRGVGSGQRKKTPRRQRLCRHLPRLGFPLWNPPSEAPPLQGMAKGGNPSPLRRERQSGSRLRGPWGSGANRSVVCPSGHSLCRNLCPALYTGGQKAAAVAPVAVRRLPAGLGARLSVAGDFRPGKESPISFCPALKAPVLGHCSPAHPCHKAACVSEHSGGFVAPSAPVGLPRQENNNRKERADRE